MEIKISSTGDLCLDWPFTCALLTLSQQTQHRLGDTKIMLPQACSSPLPAQVAQRTRPTESEVGDTLLLTCRGISVDVIRPLLVYSHFRAPLKTRLEHKMTRRRMLGPGRGLP